MPDAPQVPVADRAAWRDWLAQHAAGSTGVWLVYDKGPGRRLSYDDIVEEALCFGWVDSRPRALDDTHAMLYVAPRTPRSSWSRANKARVERLIDAGAMTPAGRAVVAAARARGRWNAHDRGEDGVEPLPLDQAPVALAVEAGGLRLVDGAQVLSHRSAPGPAPRRRGRAPRSF